MPNWEMPIKILALVAVLTGTPAENAIFDATGRRFQSLPVTQRMLKGALS